MLPVLMRFCEIMCPQVDLCVFDCHLPRNTAHFSNGWRIVFAKQVNRPWCLALSPITLSLLTVSKCPKPVPLQICAQRTVYESSFLEVQKKGRKNKFNVYLLYNSMLFFPFLFCFLTLISVHVVIIVISYSF